MKTTTYRPFQSFSTAMLYVVVNRGQYARYGERFETELHEELARRNPRAN